MADYTPKSYFEEKIAQKLKDKPETSKAVNAVYEFNITGDNGGVWTVDLTKEPGAVSSGSTSSTPCWSRGRSWSPSPRSRTRWAPSTPTRR